jgi:hypothetical protein
VIAFVDRQVAAVGFVGSPGGGPVASIALV